LERISGVMGLYDLKVPLNNFYFYFSEVGSRMRGRVESFLESVQLSCSDRGPLYALTAGIIWIWKEGVVGEGLIRDEPQICNLEEKFKARVRV
jgi:hypothetical protein